MFDPEEEPLEHDQTYALTLVGEKIVTKKIKIKKSGFTMLDVLMSGMIKSVKKEHFTNILDIGKPDPIDGSITMTMENNGQELGSYFKTPEQLKEAIPQLVMDWIDIMETMRSLHIIHHDVKPFNLLMKDGVLTLIDYGFTVVQTERTTGRVGTRRFAPPECLADERISPRERPAAWTNQTNMTETTNTFADNFGFVCSVLVVANDLIGGQGLVATRLGDYVRRCRIAKSKFNDMDEIRSRFDRLCDKYGEGNISLLMELLDSEETLVPLSYHDLMDRLMNVLGRTGDAVNACATIMKLITGDFFPTDSETENLKTFMEKNCPDYSVLARIL